MQYRNNLTSEWANAYFRVVTAFPVYVRVGSVESNSYYGSSMVIGSVYEHRLAEPGDELHDTHGGVFLVTKAGKVYEARSSVALLEKGAFEKTYGGCEEEWPVGSLTRIKKGRDFSGDDVEGRKTPTAKLGDAPGVPIGHGVHRVVELL
jgi:hypothetical protein